MAIIEEAWTLRAAADAIQEYRQALAWLSSGPKDATKGEAIAAGGLTVGWDWGRGVAGYDGLQREVTKIVGERMDELLSEALTRLRFQAVQAQRKASLVSVEPAPPIIEEPPVPPGFA